MNIQNKLKNIKDEKSYSSPAKRTMEHLKPILSKSEELQKRWMWELLQNASDLGAEVDTEFEITNTSLIFRHNGKAFSLDEAFNLIMPDSSKDEDLHDLDKRENLSIGQFGTGFISTHILSKTIRIKGIVEDREENKYYSFSFKLDRSNRENKEFLIQSIKESEKEYGESLTEVNKNNIDKFSTEFIYDLTDTYSTINGNQMVSMGIQILEDLLPFVFAFRPQLKSVRVKDSRGNGLTIKNYIKEEVKTENRRIKLLKTVCKTYPYTQPTTIATIATVQEEKTSIAVKVKMLDKRVEIQSFPDYSPKLYCAFPMIGTTDFNFPVVLHSEHFVPNRERDGIEITKYDEENRKRLIEAKEAFITLIELIEEYEWDYAYHLFDLTKNNTGSNEIKQWINKNIINPVTGKLTESNIIRVSCYKTNNFRSLSEILIPYVDKRKTDKYETLKELFSLGKQLFEDELPIESQYEKWFDKLDFDIFNDKKIDLSVLLEKISDESTSLSQFQKNYSLNEEQAIQYLLRVCRLVNKINEKDLLNNYAILPNQNDDFCLLKDLKLDSISHKSIDSIHEEEIKQIGASLLDENCKDNLLHKKVEIIADLIELDRKYELAELCKAIDDELRDFEGNYQNNDFKRILKKLFSWHDKCGLSGETLDKLFPYFSREKPHLYLNTKTTEEIQDTFDIEMSGKSKQLAKLANSDLTVDDLEVLIEKPELVTMLAKMPAKTLKALASNPEDVTSFLTFVNERVEDHPDKNLGNIGEKFLYSKLCEEFGESRVKWDDKPEYDFRILEKDLCVTKYYIDAKTTGRGIANSDFVPFYMRMAQWKFLEKEQALNKYVIARIFKNGNDYDVKYLKINFTQLKSKQCKVKLSLTV